MRNRSTHRSAPAAARRAVSALALGLTVTLTAGACGNEDTASATAAEVSDTLHNEADVAFASDMLQHHAQALSMVDLTRGRTLDPAVERLAEQIREAQAPEIETFTDWLTEWDQEIPETMRDHANAGHHMGDMAESMEGMHSDMPGMMTAEDMTALENVSNAKFQTMWLEMMIEHHAGAVEMARTEQSEGRFKPAVDLAGDIIESQSAEIVTMQDMLDS